jgi:hypothetical protein
VGPRAAPTDAARVRVRQGVGLPFWTPSHSCTGSEQPVEPYFVATGYATSSTMGDNGSDTHQPGAGADSGGCEHYRRKCDVLAPCCGRYFCCHLCHDEHFASNYADGDACSVEMKVTYHQAGAATHCSLSTPIPSIVQQPPHSRYAPHRPRQTSKISPQERCNALKVVWRAGPAR